MKTTLVSIPTATTPLDGAWYEPDGPARGAVLLFHGNTMNFYMGAPRFLPPVLAALGLACLAFNRRGRDILGIRDSRAPEGAAFQLVEEAIEDNRIAAQWVAGQGFPAPAVIGHSNGGMLAVRHVADRPHTPALVLLSAHCGGKDMVPLACRAGLLAANELDSFSLRAKALVQEGKGKELMLMPGWWYVTTAASFLDLENCPDVLALAPKVACPTLYLRGDQEARDLYPAEAFAERCGAACEVQVVPDCGHFYVRREDEIARRVTSWLAPVLKPR